MQRTLKYYLLAIVLCFTSVAQADEWVYTFRPGDTLWDICSKYVAAANCWNKIAQRNQIENPRQVRPGTRLYLPIAWLKVKPAAATVVAVIGEAQIVRSDGSISAASLGSTLAVGDALSTQAGSVRLQFADGSQLLIKSDSELKMDTLSVYGDTGIADTRVRLNRGRARATVRKNPNGSSRYEIITPAAVAAARGTAFRVSAVDGAVPTMRTEVVEGEVQVGDGSSAESVGAGFAVAASVGEGVSKSIALLEPPELEDSLPEAVTVFPWVLDWATLSGAETYRVEVLQVAESKTLLDEYVTRDSKLTFDALAEGLYELRVRGIDANNFEGFDSIVALNVVKPITVVQPVVNGVAKSTGEGKHTVSWSWDSTDHVTRYKVELSALCEGKRKAETYHVEGRHFQSHHEHCEQVVAVISPVVTEQSMLPSVPVTVELPEEKRGMWAIILMALGLVALSL